MGLTHPYRSIDVNMISHIGKTEKELFASTSMNYLTYEKQKMNVGLAGGINILHKLINLEASILNLIYVRFLYFYMIKLDI